MKYLVIGETFIDAYVLLKSYKVDTGTMAPVVSGESWLNNKELRKETFGGAANLKSILEKKLSDKDQITFYTNKTFPIKLRLFVDEKNIIRFDQNDSVAYDSDLIINFVDDIPNYDVIIVSNYHKGLLPDVVVKHIGEECIRHNKTSFIDTNIFNENYLYFDYIKINQKTAEQAIFGDDFPLHLLPVIPNLATLLKEKYSKKSDYFRDFSNIIATVGADGCQVCNKHISNSQLIVNIKKEKIVDSIGAGDVFFASLIYHVINCGSYNLADICSIANEEAKQSCMNLGTLQQGEQNGN